ncbi:MAG: tyrosine-type recombinase/integrase [Acidaminococcaceae bacterium]|nr:tyrosine-type recombinase/integrase [Acidaminococcaceae bacterium]
MLNIDLFYYIKTAAEKSTAVSKIEIKLNLTALRHFYATYLISKGVDIKVVQKLAGHKDIKVTL